MFFKIETQAIDPSKMQIDHKESITLKRTDIFQALHLTLSLHIEPEMY